MSDPWKITKRWGLRLAKLLGLAAIVGGIIYWTRFTPIPVSSYRVERGPIAAEVMGTGTLEARVAATISPKIAGRVERVSADQGERVAVGDLLVELDDDELEQQVSIAQANVEASLAAIDRLTADKARTTAVFTQAEKAHARNSDLVQRKAASQDELDRATEALAVAAAGVSRAEAGILEGQKELVAAEQTLEYHQARLDDTRIKAPFNGMIVKRNREAGDVVVPGSAVLTLISTEELWVSAWVDETEMARLSEGQMARVVFRSEPEKSYPGKVVRLGREADRETREFIVDVRVLELPSNWAVGQRAEAYIEVARRSDVVSIPSRWVVVRDGESGVFVNVNGRATWRLVTLGLRNRDRVEIPSGLSPGDWLVAPRDARTQLTAGRMVVVP